MAAYNWAERTGLQQPEQTPLGGEFGISSGWMNKPLAPQGMQQPPPAMTPQERGRRRLNETVKLRKDNRSRLKDGLFADPTNRDLMPEELREKFDKLERHLEPALDLEDDLALNKGKAQSSMEAWKKYEDRAQTAQDVYSIAMARKPEEAAAAYGKQKALDWLYDETADSIGEAAGEYLGKGMGKSAEKFIGDKYSGAMKHPMAKAGASILLGEGDVIEETAETGVKWAAAQGARVVGNYFGGPVVGEAAKWVTEALFALA